MKNSIILAFLILSVSSPTTVHAANFTWTGNSSSTWSGSSNWVEGSAPANSTTTDTAIFNQASYANQPNYGTTSIAGITVGGQSGDFAGALTLNGTALTVGSGGITLNPGAVNAVTLNGSIRIDGNQTWSKFSNAGTFRINANITNNSSTTPVELTFNASQREGSPFTNRIFLLGSISDNGNGTVSLRKTGLGVLSLEGSQSTFTGGIVNEAGSIQLVYSANSTNLRLPGTGGLVLRGGGFFISGVNSTARQESVTSTTLEAGGGSLGLSSTSASMHLGNLTRTGGSVRFSDQTTGNFLTNTANTNGILGAWATFNSLDWATNLVNGANGTIAAYTDYTNIDALGSIISDNSTANVRISANGSSGNIALGNDTTTINTLLQSNNATAATVDFVGKTLRTSGIMVASGAASLSIGTDPGAGTLTAKEGDSELHLVNFSANNTLTINSVIADNGNATRLTKFGSGTVVLSAVNTYTGPTAVNLGTLQFSFAHSLYSGNETKWTAENINVSRESTLAFNVGGSSEFNNSHIGTLLSNLATSNSTTSGMREGSSLGFDTTNAVGGNFTLDQVISDTGGDYGGTRGLVKLGNGTLTLSANNTYTFTTSVLAGTLATSEAERISDSSAVSVAAGATFQLGGNETVGSISGAGNYSLAGFTLTAGGDNTRQTVSGSISGAGGSLTKTGFDLLILSGNNTYTGSTTISAGVLNIQHANALGTTAQGTTVASGAALQLQGNITVGAEALSLNGTGVSATGTLRNISGSNTYGGAITLAGNTTIGSDAGTLTLSSGSSITGTDTNLTFVGAGHITINDAIATGSGTLTKNGTGTVTLSGNNTYTGATTINAGNLTISNNTALGTTAQGTTVASGAALQLQGNITVGAEALSLNGTGVSATGTLRNISGSNTYGGAITLAGNTTIGSDAGTLTLSSGSSITGTDTNLTFVGAGHITINDAIATGSGTLTKNGTGTVTLSGNNTYTGNTTVNAGTLVFQNKATRTGGSLVTAAAAGTVGLGVGGGGVTDYSASEVANLFSNTLSGFTLNASSGVAIDTTAGNFTQNATLNGTRALTKLGNNTLTLSGNNTYTGNTTVGTSGGANAGTLQLSGLGKISNAAVNIFGGTLDLNGSNQSITTLTMGGGASGSTAAVTTGNGTLRLGGNVVFSATNNASGASISGKLDLGNATRTFTIGDSSVATSDLTIDAAISNGGLTKNGTGTLTLSGNNTYTGNTTVNAGTLTASAANALGGTTSINVNGGSLLLTAGNAVNDNANINLGGGTLAVNGNFNENVGVLSLSANSTLDLNGFTGILRFGGVGSWANTPTLSIWNWNGNTNQHIVFAAIINPNQYFNQILFFSDNGSTLVGNAQAQTFNENGFEGTKIIAVPEPETYIIVMVFLLGFGIYQLRLARKGQGRLAHLTFLRQKRS